MEVTIQKNTKTKLIFKAILFCFAFTGIFVVFSFVKSFLPNHVERIAHGIIGTLAALLTTVLFIKFDRKQFSDIGLRFERKTMGRFLAGVITGVIIMGILSMSVMYFLKVSIEVNPESSLLNFLVMTLPLIPLAFMEELGFRAYPLEILKDKLGVRLSIFITSLLFALYHIANGWTIASSFYGPAIWGLVFGIAAIYSKGIAMPTGIHYAANLTTAAFGAADNTVSIWTIRQADNPLAKNGLADWVGAISVLGLLAFAIICIELYVRRKNNDTGAIVKAGLT